MLTELVDKYMEEYAPLLNDHISFYTTSEKDPATIIHLLAFAIGEDNRTHPNQRRVSRDAKKHLEQYLLMNFESIIGGNTDFDEAFHKLLKLQGIGAQTAYDTVKRIGLAPKRVYLHGGSLIGAENLFSSLNQVEKLKGNNVLDVFDFPKELQILSPLHIEHFLCKFKTSFHKGSTC